MLKYTSDYLYVLADREAFVGGMMGSQHCTSQKWPSADFGARSRLLPRRSTGRGRDWAGPIPSSAPKASGKVPTHPPAYPGVLGDCPLRVCKGGPPSGFTAASHPSPQVVAAC